MTSSSIDTRMFDKLKMIFSVDTRKKIIGQAGRVMGVKAESVVPEYPPPSGKPRAKIYTRQRADGTTYASAFKSQAQQGKVFAMISEGQIPYTRTGLLGRSITSGIANLTGSSVTVKIGTAVRYAPLVIGPDGQQDLYHKGHWWQLDAVMAENTPAIEEAGADALARGIEQELKQR